MRTLLLGASLVLALFWLGLVEVSWPDGGWEPRGQGTEQETNVPDERAVDSTGDSTATVRYVIDGDTFDTDAGARVRLLGIDTPEQNECYYQEATDFVRSLIQGKVVRLAADETDQDKYERRLRHVYVLGEEGELETHLNLQLVEEGYAEILPIPPDRQYRKELAAAEAAAQAAGKGRWGACGE